MLVFGTFCAPKQQVKHLDDTQNPLICDPDTGCAIPGAAEEKTTNFSSGSKPVRLIYFTDPICSSCWGIEPQLRRLKQEYGDYFDIEYHMGGLLPSWDVYNSGGISKPSDVAHHWDEVSGYYDMPIDGDIWLEDPLPSSYPPSIAFKGAQLQDQKKAVHFLRRIREMVFLEKKNITRWEYLAQAAEETGLDTSRLKADLQSAAMQAFFEDLQLARNSGVRGFPTLFFTDSSGKSNILYGVKPYGQFEELILKLHPAAQKKNYEKSPLALFSVYPTLCTREFAVLAGLEREEALKLLENLYKDGKLDRTLCKNGPLWKWKDQ